MQGGDEEDAGGRKEKRIVSDQSSGIQEMARADKDETDHDPTRGRTASDEASTSTQQTKTCLRVFNRAQRQRVIPREKDWVCLDGVYGVVVERRVRAGIDGELDDILGPPPLLVRPPFIAGAPSLIASLVYRTGPTRARS